MSMATLVLVLIKISIVLSVFAIGLKATFSDDTNLIRPAELARALLSMNVLMPAFALLAFLTSTRRQTSFSFRSR